MKGRGRGGVILRGIRNERERGGFIWGGVHKIVSYDYPDKFQILFSFLKIAFTRTLSGHIFFCPKLLGPFLCCKVLTILKYFL